MLVFEVPSNCARKTVLDEVTAALAAIQPEGTFATELTCSSSDLHIEVEGVGPLRFPISATTARRLCAVGRPAPFGRRERTLLDPAVRDALEIGATQLTIDDSAWRRTLDPQLALVRQRLGFPDTGTIEATLDKMLVYGPGQFFAAHQDSERSDDMMGSLIVELPSRHQGGALLVEHHKDTQVFRGAKGGSKDLSLVAFYADCRHEVKPVTSGYRVTLTYHLRYRGDATAETKLRASDVERLAASVRAYFSTPAAAPYSTSALRPPERLIYLLDHEYTQRSLGFRSLKNADRLRVSALREVAERLDCKVFLALADVHESWSCDEVWDDGRSDYYEMDESDDEGEEDHELIDLIDTEIELRHWIGVEGKITRVVQVAPLDSEVCSTRGSAEMTPFRSEHEGYMGNYGNTVDRWYHRAALVMWPRARDFALRARVSPSWAVGRITSRIKAGAKDEALAMATELLPFWSAVASKELGETFVLRLLTAVRALDDAELALELLSPLGFRGLTPTTTNVFVELVERHGLSWAQRLLEKWTKAARYSTSSWLAFFPRLCEALSVRGEQSKALAVWLLEREATSFEQRYNAARRPGEGLLPEGAEESIDDLLALLEAAAGLGYLAIRDRLVAFVTAPERALPLLTAGILLRKAREKKRPAEVRALGLGTLYRRVMGALEDVLARPPRSKDDWSIEPPGGCNCALCKTLSAFLVNPAAVKLPWPLAKERRRHIHGVLDRSRLPVTHTTVRKGSPQTLVLTKQAALFKQAAAQRAQQRELLVWLRKQRSAFEEPELTGRRGETDR
jgi:hypothetical protein